MDMAVNLKNIAARYAAALKVSDGSTVERPTVTEICFCQLEGAVSHMVKYPPRRTEPEKPYDRFWLYARRDKLQTIGDVESASDDVLLEALGLPDVKNWGWLHFINRDLNWIELLAGNWGWPALTTGYSPGCAGGYSGTAMQYAETTDRRLQAALHFVDLMRERGVDPVAQVRDLLARRGIEESNAVEYLQELNGLAYFVYTCESFAVRPEVRADNGEVVYKGESRPRFLNEILAAASRRRAINRLIN